MARGSHTINVAIKGDKGDLSRAINGAISDLKGLNRQVGRVNRDMETMRKRFQGVTKDTGNLRTATRQTTDALRTTNYRIIDQTNEHGDLARALRRSTRESDAFNRSQQRATFERTPLFGALARTFAGLRETARAVSQSFDDIGDASADVNARLRDTARASASADDGLIDLSHSLGGDGGGGGAGVLPQLASLGLVGKEAGRGLKKFSADVDKASQSTQALNEGLARNSERSQLFQKATKELFDTTTKATRGIRGLAGSLTSLAGPLGKIISVVAVAKVGFAALEIAFKSIRVSLYWISKLVPAAFGGLAFAGIAKFITGTERWDQELEQLTNRLRKTVRSDLPEFTRLIRGGKGGEDSIFDKIGNALQKLDFKPLEKPLIGVVDAFASLKNTVLDSGQTIIEIFADTLIPAFENFVRYTVPGMITGIENFFYALTNTDAGDFFDNLFNPQIEENVWENLGTWFENAGTKLGDFVEQFGEIDFETIEQDVSDIADAFNTISEAIQTVSDTISTISTIKDFLDPIVNPLTNAQEAWESFKSFLEGIKEWFEGFELKPPTLPVPNTAGFMNGLNVAWTGAQLIFTGIVNSAKFVLAIPGILRGAAVAAASAFLAGLRRIPGILAGIWARVVAGASAMAANLIAAISYVPGVFFSIGANIASSMASGIASGASSVISAAVNLARSAIEAGLSALGIGSPSKVFVGMGSNVATSFALGMNKSKKFSFKAFERWMKDLGTVAVKYNNDLGKKQERAAKNWAKRWNKAIDDVKDAWREWSRLQTERRGGTRASKLADAWREAAKAVADMKKEIQSLTDEYNEITNPTPVQRAAQAWQDAKDNLRDIQRTIQNLNDDYAETMGTTPGFAQTSAYEAAKDKLEELKDAARRMGDTIKDNLNFGQALEAMQSVRSGGFLAELRKQRDQTQKFSEGLAKLKEMGASPEILKQIQEAGVVDGTAIMEQLQTPEALREAEGLVKDVMNIAESVASEDTGVYSAAISAAKDGVTAAFGELQTFWEGQQDIAEQELTNSYNTYKGFLNEELAELKAVEREKWAAVKDFWKERLKTERQGINNLKKEWRKYKKWWENNFTGSYPGSQGGARTASASRSGTVVNNYNTFSVQATSPYSAGKEIVKNIQAYEKAAGTGWRR